MNDILVLYAVNTHALTGYRFQQLLEKLPPALQHINSQYKRETDRQLHLSGKLLLLERLQQLGFDAEKLHELEYSPNNKPNIPGTVSFNITHSGNYAVCAFTKSGNIGVDIEQIRPVDFHHFTHVMHTGEWNRIKKSNDPYRTFFRLWTIKESVIKAGDLSLDIMNEISTDDRSAMYAGKKWNIRPINIDDDHVCHVVHDCEIGDITTRGVAL